MSVPPRQKTDNGSAVPEKDGTDTSFRSAIDKITEIYSQTDVFRDDLTKTGKDIAKIAEAMKKYISPNTSVNKDDDDDPQKEAKRNKICKVYGCIYKGTYDGIIDGLKQVAEDSKAEQLKQEKIDATKEILKTAGKVAIQAPEKITKALVNLFAFERSEILNLFRSIYHGVGYDGSEVDYQQKAFRLMLEQEHDRKKLLKSGNLMTQNEEILGELTGIREAVGGGADRGLFKRNQSQIELLKKIAEGVGAQKKGFLNMRTLLRPKWMMDMSLYQVTLLREISENTKASSQGMWFTGWFKSSESQVDILKDIRRYLAPREKDQNKVWKTLNTPVFSLFKKDVKREEANIADLGSQNDEVIKQLEHNNDYQEDIYNVLKKSLAIERLKLAEEVKLLQKAETGLAMFTIKSASLTPYQVDDLRYSQGIEQYNLEELNAIKDLPKSISECIIMSKSEDDVFESLEATRQEALERGMDDVEEKRDGVKRTSMLQTTVDNIYKHMVSQGKNMPFVDEKGMLATIGSKVASVTGVLGDMAEMKQAVPWLDSVQKVKFVNNKQIVSLSNSTLRTICNCIEDNADDDMDLPGKRRRKRRSHRTPKKIPKIKKPGMLAKGKGLLKTGALKAAPILTGGIGTGGLLTASGSTIAGLGAGAMATAAAGVAAAGAVGYGIGTVLNKGIDNLITARTDGEAKSLGGLFYNLTHRKEMKEIRARKVEAAKIKEKAYKKQQANPLTRKDDMDSALKKSIKPDGIIKTVAGTTAGIVAGTAVLAANGTVELATGTVDLAKGMIEKSAPVASELASQSMTIAKSLTAGSLSLAKDIVDKGINFDWQDSMNNGWQNSVKAMDELSDSVGVLSAIKESQTVGAMQQVYQDGKSFATGGNSTTNIQVPVSPHDVDRGTNLLVHSYGS